MALEFSVIWIIKAPQERGERAQRVFPARSDKVPPEIINALTPCQPVAIKLWPINITKWVSQRGLLLLCAQIWTCNGIFSAPRSSDETPRGASPLKCERHYVRCALLASLAGKYTAHKHIRAACICTVLRSHGNERWWIDFPTHSWCLFSSAKVMNRDTSDAFER